MAQQFRARSVLVAVILGVLISDNVAFIGAQEVIQGDTNLFLVPEGWFSEPFSFRCPQGQAITRVQTRYVGDGVGGVSSSSHRPLSRIWRLECSNLPFANETDPSMVCQRAFSPVPANLNDPRRTFSCWQPNGGAFNMFESAAGGPDTMGFHWNHECCSHSRYTWGTCYTSNKADDFYMEFDTFPGYYITTLHSVYNFQLKDRMWKVVMCAFDYCAGGCPAPPPPASEYFYPPIHP